MKEIDAAVAEQADRGGGRLHQGRDVIPYRSVCRGAGSFSSSWMIERQSHERCISPPPHCRAVDTGLMTCSSSVSTCPGVGGPDR